MCNYFGSQNSDVYWKPTVPVQADVATFMVKLGDSLRGSFKVDQDWLSELSDRETAKQKSNEEVQYFNILTKGVSFSAGNFFLSHL